MACVRSIACLRDDVPVAEGEGAITERGAIDEGHDSAGLVEGTESMHASHAGSHSHAEGDSDEGSHTRSYYFGPLTVTVNCIREMINHGYFVEGSARAPVEETILEPDSDEAVVFEEFFFRWLEDASAPSSHQYIVEISSTAPSAYPQCHWVAIEIYLGDG
jgi:hypothetical protein